MTSARCEMRNDKYEIRSTKSEISLNSNQKAQIFKSLEFNPLEFRDCFDFRI